MCEPHPPAHTLHQAVGPKLSTSPRAMYTRRYACTVGDKLRLGADGVQTNWTNKAFDHRLISALRGTTCVSCLPANAATMCSSVGDILPIQSPLSSHSDVHSAAQVLNSDSASFGVFAPSTPPNCAASPAPAGVRSPQSLCTCYSFIPRWNEEAATLESLVLDFSPRLTQRETHFSTFETT